MSINQIALLLEITGFLLASFFIAMLKIEIVKSLADKVKSSIIATSETSKSIRFQIQLTLVILILFAVLNRMIKTRFPKGIKPWQYPIFLLKEIVFTYLIPVLEIIPFFLLMLSLKGLNFMAEKLAGKDVITNFLIILGTFMVFTGLILELIATW